MADLKINPEHIQPIGEDDDLIIKVTDIEIGEPIIIINETPEFAAIADVKFTFVAVDDEGRVVGYGDGG